MDSEKTQCSKMTIKELLTRIKKLVGFNGKTLLLFTLVYSFVTGLIVTGLYQLFFFITLKLSGNTYVGDDTLISFLTDPFTILFILVFALIIIYLILFQISGIIAIYEASIIGKKIGFREIWHAGSEAGIRVFKPKNWGLLPFLLLLMPFVGIAQLSNLMFSINLPEFIADFIAANKLLSALVGISILLLLVLSVRLAFSIHYFVVEKITFGEACKKSRRLIKRRFMRTVFSFVALVVILGVFVLLLEGILGLIIKLITIESGIYLSSVGFTTIMKELALIISVFAGIVMPLIALAFLTIYYNTYKKSDDALEQWSSALAQRDSQIHKRQWIGFVILACLLISTVAFSVVRDQQLNETDIMIPDVIAHRGDSVQAPENSKPAFELAIQEGVDWIELDVHQTADGKLVISHDDSLSRIAGIDKCVHELTYAELSKLDVGSWFSSEYAGLRIATLDEVLDLCKGKVKLQIEIKPTEYDQDIEAGVVAAIRAHNMEDQCTITSLKTAPLIKVKEIAPDIQTGYIMVVAFGDIQDVSFADVFAIEASNATETLIRQIHTAGKKVYIWTVNDMENVQKLVDVGVDGIMSDNPVDLQATLKDSDYSGGWGKLLRGLL